MKLNSIIIFLLLNFLLVREAWCQATFRFQNRDFSVDAPVFDGQGVLLSGSNYSAELYGGIAPSSLAPATSEFGARVTATFFTGTGAGYFQGPSMYFFTVPGGGFAWMQVRAWDTRLGSTYEQAAALGAGGYGESALLYIWGGDPTAVPPVAPRQLVGLQSFSLRPIPEPSVWQLSLLGLPAMLWLRRKRR